MTELARMRRAYDAIEEPTDQTVSAAREVLLREIGSSERPRPSRPERRWVFAAIAAAILVGGLLVTPALGIGGRLLELIRGAPSPPEVPTAVWSPDGRMIAFSSWRDGQPEVYVMNADGSGQQNLSRHPARDGSPAWSPDGRRIAFVSRRDGQPEVYVMNADGSGQRNLTRDPAADVLPVWSPGGRTVAFVKRISFVGLQPGSPILFRNFLYVVNVDGSGLRRLTQDPVSGTPGAPLAPVWSPDVRTIQFGPYIASTDGSGQRRLPRHIPWSGAWSPDGRKIASVGSFPRGSRGTPFANYEIYVMNADGSGQRRLTRSPGGDGNPAWSPDGRKIAFVSHRDDNPEIYVMNADGSGQQRLTRSPANDGWFSWSPDGRKVVFVSDRDGSYEVYVMNADGSGQRRLT